MSELDDAFAKAQDDVTKLSSRPGNDDMLGLYALYKQATQGDSSNGKKPGGFDFVGKAKFDAWSKLSGTSSDDAKQSYIDKVAALQAADS